MPKEAKAGMCVVVGSIHSHIRQGRSTDNSQQQADGWDCCPRCLCPESQHKQRMLVQHFENRNHATALLVQTETAARKTRCEQQQAAPLRHTPHNPTARQPRQHNTVQTGRCQLEP
jgi:hypothetical protein